MTGGCSDSQGDMDIIFPKPMFGLSGGGYKVRVGDYLDNSDADCSAEFMLITEEGAEEMVGVYSEPFLTVTVPTTGDIAEAGEQYTIEWEYDNGLGSAVDRFDIDLYIDDGGDGDCGTWLTSICDKTDRGCKDSMGDYDIAIPDYVPTGSYKIRIGTHAEDGIWDCSGPFIVIGDDANSFIDFSFSYEI
ncbi:unnamed protein product [Discosporangium mesarthrocarpum]